MCYLTLYIFQFHPLTDKLHDLLFLYRVYLNHVFITHLSAGEHLGTVHFLAVSNTMVMRITTHISVEKDNSSLGKCQGVVYLGHMINSYLAFWEIFGGDTDPQTLNFLWLLACWSKQLVFLCLRLLWAWDPHEFLKTGSGLWWAYSGKSPELGLCC